MYIQSTGNEDMETVAAIQLGLTGLLLNLHGSDMCKFGANCDYPCHCQNNAVCDPFDGSCPTGCDDGDRGEPVDDWYIGAWSGYACQIGNVAYGKIATQGEDTVGNHNAGLAIDGNHDPYPNNGSCTYSRDYPTGSMPGWWQVDLGANFFIYGVEITNRDVHNHFSQYINITVSDTEGADGEREFCYMTGSEGIALLHLSVNCSQPLLGRYVRLQRYGGISIHQMQLCEVHVYGYLFHDCSDGYYGVACGTPCNCQCHDITGECPSQNCTGGWMGHDCQTECNPGTWGTNCQWSCNCLEDHEVCDRFEGRCISGCHNGFGGIGCNLVLPMLNSSTVEWANPTSSSVEVRFDAWVPGNQEEHIPGGYIVQQRRSNNATWVYETDIDHDLDQAQVLVVLGGLEPQSEYYVRVIPYIVDGGETFLGHPTTESGPFWTLDKDVSDFPVALVAGVITSLIVLVVLALVIVFVIRRHFLCRNKASQNPTEFELTPPSLNNDVGPGGQENRVYEEEIVE